MDVDNHEKKSGSLLVTKQQHTENQVNTPRRLKKRNKKTKKTLFWGGSHFFWRRNSDVLIFDRIN